VDGLERSLAAFAANALIVLSSSSRFCGKLGSRASFLARSAGGGNGNGLVGGDRLSLLVLSFLSSLATPPNKSDNPTFPFLSNGLAVLSSSSLYRASADVDMDPFDSEGCCHLPSVPFCIAGGRCWLFRIRLVAVSGEQGRARASRGTSLLLVVVVVSGTGAALPFVAGLIVPLPLTSFTNDLKRDLVGSAGSGDVTLLRVRNPFNPRPVGTFAVEVAVAVGMMMSSTGSESREPEE